MEEIALFAFVARLVYATAALILILFTLRWFNGINNRGLRDKTAGFDAALRRIRADSQAAAMYYGLRFVGICLLYGMVMS